MLCPVAASLKMLKKLLYKVKLGGNLKVASMPGGFSHFFLHPECNRMKH